MSVTEDEMRSREISARYGIPLSHYDSNGAGGPMMPGYGLPSHYYGDPVDLGDGTARCRQWSDLTPQQQRNFVPPKLDRDKLGDK